MQEYEDEDDYDDSSSETVRNLWECHACDYRTTHRSDYRRHLTTQKHFSQVAKRGRQPKKTIAPSIPSTCEDKDKLICACGNVYSYRQSLQRHRRVCNALNPSGTSVLQEEPDVSPNGDSGKMDQAIVLLIAELVKNQQDTREFLKEVIGRIGDNHSHNVNSNNKTFNLNFFLNNTCKDAVNLFDFIEKMDINLKDVIRFAEKGYVHGLSAAITDRLCSMDITERPIHCTDEKRQTLYIKDQGAWTLDGEHVFIKKAVLKTLDKSLKELFFGYKKTYPDCVKSTGAHSDEYNKIIINMGGGPGDVNVNELNERVMGKVIRSVVVDKSQFLIDKTA